MPWAIGGQEPGGALDLGCELGPVVCDFVPGGDLGLSSVGTGGVGGGEWYSGHGVHCCRVAASVCTYLLGMTRVLGSGQM